MGYDFLKLFKEVYSCALLGFSTAIVCALIFTGETTIAHDVHPALAFVMLWVSIIWLTQVEGGQASTVGLPPVDMDLYKESHPTAHKIMTIINQGDNLDRYLMGRQFMVLALVFIENLATHPINPDMDLWGMPKWVNAIFLGSGLAVFFMTAMVRTILRFIIVCCVFFGQSCHLTQLFTVHCYDYLLDWKNLCPSQRLSVHVGLHQLLLCLLHCPSLPSH